MGNHCGSALKKKEKARGDAETSGESAAHDQRRPSALSAESIPYAPCVVPLATTDSPSLSAGPTTAGATTSTVQHHLTVNRAEYGDSGSSTGDHHSGQFTSNASSNPPTSPVPSSCSPVPPPSPCFDALYTIPTRPGHVIGISGGLNQLRVFAFADGQIRAVRTLMNVIQPRHLQLLDPYKALVLCNRELMVFNIDQGKLVCKLKGVMNQKMPFFGLHSDQYAVALSRNRMYVNLLSLTTGNLETTFKVGEDRFLNSLLVSHNGRICVCGDETQKPFPLLVWDLTARKLIYDLRIPHHEFITRLAAISHDGHFVVSACRETTSTSNFIVVYDLQSGTQFKKWKPECNTVSIAISSKDSCVLNGLENSQIQVWDLSTGAIRFTLDGHTSPVDKLLVADCGQFMVSYDSIGKDSSIRVWNINDGSCVKVHLPEFPVSCCLLSATASHLLLCPKDSSTLHVLPLDVGIPPSPNEIYGDETKDGLEIDLSKE